MLSADQLLQMDQIITKGVADQVSKLQYPFNQACYNSIIGRDKCMHCLMLSTSAQR